MKLHLPKGLRTALLACFAAFAGVGTTLSTATITGGVFAVAMAGQAVADELSLEGNDYTFSESNSEDSSMTIWMSGGNTLTVENGVTYYATLDNPGAYSKAGDGVLVAKSAPQWNTPTNVSVLDGELEIQYGGGKGFATGDVEVAGGATLTLAGGDALGYGGTATDNINMEGEAGNEAKLHVAEHQTMTTNLNLKGNTLVTSTVGDASHTLDSYGGKITATGDNNIISSALNVRNDLTVEVTNSTDTLTLKGLLTDGSGTADGGQKSYITKTGEGTLTVGAYADGITGGDSAIKGLVIEKGDVAIERNLTVGTLTLSSGSGISVAVDKTLTITDTSEYLAYEGEMDLPSGSWNNTEVYYKGTNTWNLLTASTSAGQIIIGAAGSTAVIGGNNTDSFQGDRTIMGNYLINGDLYFNRGGNATDASIGSTGKLEVTGDAVFSNSQYWTVEDGGQLKVGGTLGLGHSAGSSYPGSLTISGDGSAVTVNELKFFNNSASTKLEMTAGTLTIGAGGVTTYGENKATIYLHGGTVKASADWATESEVMASLKGVTIDGGDHTITLNGATTFMSTVTNKGGLVLNGALTVENLDLLEKTKVENSDGKGDYSDGDNGYFVGKYWVVRNEGTENLTLANTTATLGSGNSDPLTLTQDATGIYISSTGTSGVYYVFNAADYVSTKSADASGLYIASGQELTFSDKDLGKDLTLAGAKVTFRGSSMKAGNTITLVSEGDTLSNNTISMGNATLKDTITGTGNLVLEKNDAGVFNLENTIVHTGALVLQAGVTVQGNANLNNKGTLTLNGLTIEAKYIGDNVTDITLDNATLTANGKNLNKGLLTVKTASTISGDSRVQFTEGAANSGVLTISGAQVFLGTTAVPSASMQTGDVVIENNGSLYMSMQAGNVTKANGTNADLTMKGGTLYLYATSGTDNTNFSDRTYQWGTLKLSGNNTFNNDWQGQFAFEKLTGSGELAIKTDWSELYGALFSLIEDYNGVIANNGVDNFRLLIGTVNQAKDNTIEITGKAHASAFDKKGEGAIKLNVLNLTGAGTMSAGTLSVMDGGSINATEATTLTITGGTLAGHAAPAAEGGEEAQNATTGWTLGENVALGLGTVSIADGANITINGATTFSGVVTNAGTLAFNGSLILDDEAASSMQGKVSWSDDATHSGNGCMMGASYTLVDGGTVTLGEGVTTVTLGNGSLRAEWDAENQVLKAVQDASTAYYVNNTSTYTATDSAELAKATEIVINGATLTLSSSKDTVDASAVSVFSAGDTITAAAGTEATSTLKLVDINATASNNAGYYADVLAGYKGNVLVSGGSLELAAPCNGFNSLSLSNGAYLHLTQADATYNDGSSITAGSASYICLSANTLGGDITVDGGLDIRSSAAGNANVQANISGDAASYVSFDCEPEAGKLVLSEMAITTGGSVSIGSTNAANVELQNGASIANTTYTEGGSITYGNLYVRAGSVLTMKAGSSIVNEAAVSIAAGATLTAEAGASITAKKDLSVYGTLNLAGAITGSENFNLKMGTDGRINVDLAAWAASAPAAAATDGLLTQTYTLVSGLKDSTLDLTDLKVYAGADDKTGYALKLNDAKDAIVFAVPGDVYYISTTPTNYGTVKVSGATSIALNGSGLHINNGDKATLDIAVLKDSYVQMESGEVSLSDTLVSFENNAKLTLKGSGVYEATDMTKLGSVTLDSGWAGTVSLQGVSVTGFDVDSVCNMDATGAALSTVEFKGVTGYLSQANTGDGATYAANIKLTNSTIADDPTTTEVDESATLAALTLNNGSKGDKRTFSGKVSGTGDIMRVGQGGAGAYGGNQSYTFSGDVSEWKGSFIHDFDISETSSDNKNVVTSTVTFSGNATEINAGMAHMAGNALAVIIDNTAAVAMNGLISGNTNLTSKGSGEKTLTAANTATGLLTVEAGTVTLADKAAWGGDVSVASGATLHLVGTGSYTGTLANAGTLQLGEGASIAGLKDNGALGVDSGATATSTGDVKVSSFNNLGTLNLGANKLELTAAPTVGGSVVASELTTAAASSFTSLEVGTLNLASTLEVKGALEGITTINVTSASALVERSANSATVTVESLSVPTDSLLTFAFTNLVLPQLSEADIDAPKTYTLLSLTGADATISADILNMQFDEVEEGVAGQALAGTLEHRHGTMLYTLSVSEDGSNVILTAAYSAVAWKPENDATTGVLDGSSANMAFLGGGTDADGAGTVEIVPADPTATPPTSDTTLESITVNSDGDDYTFTTQNSATDTATLVVGEFLVQAGEATIDNLTVDSEETEVGGTGSTIEITTGGTLDTDSLTVTDEGTVNVSGGAVEAGETTVSGTGTVNVTDGQFTTGSLTVTGSGASISVSGDGQFTTGSLTVTGSGASISVSGDGQFTTDSLTVTGSEASISVSGDGEMTVTGELDAADTIIATTGNISLGAGSDVGGIAGVTDSSGAEPVTTYGTVKVTGDDVSIVSVAATSFTATGTGTGDDAKGVTVGDMTTNSVSADDSKLSTGVVTAANDKEVVTLTSTNGATLSVEGVESAAGLQVSVGAGSTVEVGNGGNEADEPLYLGSFGVAAAEDGSAAASTFTAHRDVVLAGQAAGNLNVNSLGVAATAAGTVLDSLGSADATASSLDLTLDINGGANLTGEQALLTTGTVTGLTSLEVTVTADSLLPAGAGTYTLAAYTDIYTWDNSGTGIQGTEVVESDDVPAHTVYTLLNVSDFTGTVNLTVADEAAIQQQFALAGVYAVFGKNGNDVILTIYKDQPREWDGGSLDWAGNPNNGPVVDGNNPGDVLDLSQLGSVDALDTVQIVNLNQTTTVDVSDLTPIAGRTEGLLINHLSGGLDDQGNAIEFTLSGTDADVATLSNATDTENNLGASEFAGKLIVDGLTVNVDGGADANQLTVATTELKGTGTLDATNGNYHTGALNSTETTTELAGTIVVEREAGTVTENAAAGSYLGGYAATGATVKLGNNADQTLAAGAGLSVETVAGATNTKLTLDYANNAAAEVNSIDVEDAQVTLANGGVNTLTLGAASEITGSSELTINVNAANLGNGPLTVTTGETLTVDVDTLTVAQSDATTSRTDIDVTAGTTHSIVSLSDNAGSSVSVDNIVLDGTMLNRYFKDARVEGNSIVGDLRTDYYSENVDTTENGKTGLDMVGTAFFQIDPAANPDLADVMDALENHAGDADRLGAAVAGSGVASLGMAIAGDVERQLKAIRNRTTTMGVDPGVVNEDMPYFNAWINAEGDHRSLDEDSTLAGYTLTSWGGTVGFDMDVNPSLTMGLAVTAMYGDFSAESTDVVEGDVDTYYISAFARVQSSAWTHTFVATVGKNESELTRTVSHANGSYRTTGETDGISFGALYEVSRTFALNEDATACWQPVFNVAYRHIEVDGYSESGSDAALKLGDQSLDTVTFGLGARLQAVVGENLYNRTSVFEARALVKLDAGDRESEMDTAFINASAAKGSIKSAEMDAFGFEVGAGLTIPMGMESGSVFVDGSFDFRGSYTSVNGTLGYRVNF